MKKAVMYGAGNIGRGFIGKVFSESGYNVCFLDVNPTIIQAFNEKKEYMVRIVANDEEYCEKVSNVYAVEAGSERAMEEIANCDIMAIAVGVNILPKIIDNLAKGIRNRINKKSGPLNILLAENQIHVDKMMRAWIYEKLDDKGQVWADENLGLVEVSIGRMVPPLTADERKNDPLLIAVEPYCELPVDSMGFKGEIPSLVGLVPFTPFDFYIKRKLFLHNMGHAVCAYLGSEKGYNYIAEAIEDNEIFAVVSGAMEHVVQALHKEYPQIPFEEIKANKEDLLFRFRNRALKDTIARVAAEPLRKLRSNDRLVGAALYCLSQGITPDNIVTGIISAYNYANPQDTNSKDIQQFLTEIDIREKIKRVSSLEADSSLGRLIIRKWKAVDKPCNLAKSATVE